MTKSVVLDETGIHRSVTVPGLDEPKITDLGTNLTEGLQSLEQIGYFNSGLIPVDGSGVVSIRAALGYTQVVYQAAPGSNYVIWGDYEGSEDAVQVMLAQPYRIFILDYSPNNGFIGGRHFYTMQSIFRGDEPLYHVNLPNTNCRGYGTHNGVGWVCLYGHQTPEAYKTIAEKMNWGILRMSGDEAYNDGNMSETDGPRFYADHGKPHFICDRDEWAAKTKKEGHAWAMNPDLWIPIQVEGMDSQKRHYDGGPLLTLEMAMYGKYGATYDDPHMRPFNKIDRSDVENPTPTEILNALNVLKAKQHVSVSVADVTKRAADVVLPKYIEPEKPVAKKAAKKKAAAKKAVKKKAVAKKAVKKAVAKKAPKVAAALAATTTAMSSDVQF